MGTGSTTLGMGYRQRRILDVLKEANRPLPLGYLARACGTDCTSGYNNTSVSLRTLRDRGMVQQVRYGWWALA